MLHMNEYTWILAIIFDFFSEEATVIRLWLTRQLEINFNRSHNLTILSKLNLSYGFESFNFIGVYEMSEITALKRNFRSFSNLLFLADLSRHDDRRERERSQRTLRVSSRLAQAQSKVRHVFQSVFSFDFDAFHFCKAHSKWRSLFCKLDLHFS